MGMTVESTTSPAGLSEVEAARRLAARPPLAPPQTSRSYASIVRANVFTLFNLILLAFGVVTLVFGDARDALFLGILVANSSIGIVQEARAKRALDRLAALVAPTATVVRDGARRTVAVEKLVVGDLVRVEAGDQLVADGQLVRNDGLTLDESILTGESEPVARHEGDEVRSGSFAAEGSGAYTVTAVGPDSYAARITGEARAFRHPRSPLERALNRLLITLVGVMVPLGTMLGYALWRRDEPLRDSVSTATAAVVSLVPEGLILLASLTYAVAAVRMTRRGALAQQLNAIESLASVNVVCLDKTGTLTESSLHVVGLAPTAATGEAALAAALARYAACSPARNPTLAAIADSYPGVAEEHAGYVPFSSRRGWSALRLDGETYVLGVPEHFPLGGLAERAAREAESGRRVLALGTTTAALDGLRPEGGPPPDLSPLGLVVLAERLRPEARETVDYFASEGVELRVLSGDAPATVAAIAGDAGISSTGPPLDGRELPADPRALREALLGSLVVGRISPEGKRRVVEALRDSGLYVAMVGDGVNDVPALKAARLGIAQGTGTQMAKSVADLVLVRGDFASVPAMVGEGRKILRNLQRVAKLFVAKSMFATFLILTVGLTPTSYPFLPRHLTIASALTIGIPAFFLALAPSSGAWSSAAFLRGVARFAIPAGTAAGLGVVSGYLFALNVLGRPLIEARTVATTTLILVGLYLIYVLEASGRRRSAAILVLCAALAALYGLALAVPSTREFFSLSLPNPAIVLTALAGAGLAAAGLWLIDFGRPAPGGPERD